MKTINSIVKSIKRNAKSCRKVLLQALLVINIPFFGGACGALGSCLVASSALLLSSCSEDDNTTEEYPNWQATNANYWNSLYTTTRQRISSGDASWKIIKNYSIEDTLNTGMNTDYIIVNVLKEGTGSGSPLYTDSVRVRYTGRLLPSTSYKDGYVFDTTNPNGLDDSQAAVTDFVVSGVVDGFSTALQHMHIGDQWEVYIPWTLGYGTKQSSSSNIPAYSVLRFTISLVAYSRGSKLPDFNAKPGHIEWVTE